MVGQEHVLRASSTRSTPAASTTPSCSPARAASARRPSRASSPSPSTASRRRFDALRQCSACSEIDQGRFVDLIEVDAASRTKVDDTRELLENVQYAPTRGRYKVYLIDEVHMLSTHSFNALLKTLEEPPPHVKFLLATTDPQKLPVTVLSRCLQFNLKRLPPSQIGERLRSILEAEGVDYEPAALALLARAADGSMRDGLSLLDQMLAFGGGTAREAEARAMLGTIDRGHVLRLLDRLVEGDAAGLMAAVAAMDELSPDYAQVLEELAGLLQKVACGRRSPTWARTRSGRPTRSTTSRHAWRRRTCSSTTSWRSSVGATCRWRLNRGRPRDGAAADARVPAGRGCHGGSPPRLPLQPAGGVRRRTFAPAPPRSRARRRRFPRLPRQPGSGSCPGGPSTSATGAACWTAWACRARAPAGAHCSVISF
jgi:DNA polymerase III subunit gamma/tau